MDLEKQSVRDHKYLRIFWRIWWIGVVILFAFLAVQTYLVRFAHRAG